MNIASNVSKHRFILNTYWWRWSSLVSGTKHWLFWLLYVIKPRLSSQIETIQPKYFSISEVKLERSYSLPRLEPVSSRPLAGAWGCGCYSSLPVPYHSLVTRSQPSRSGVRDAGRKKTKRSVFLDDSFALSGPFIQNLSVWYFVSVLH